MTKMTNAEKLEKRSVHEINTVYYAVLALIVKVLDFIVNAHFTYKAKPGKEKGPFLMIANHASRNDFLFTAPACYPRKLNYVVGYNEFYRFPLGVFLKISQAIPKKNFTPDIHAIKEIKKVIKRGGAICILPEGMNSITGMQQPVVPGGAKLIKQLGVPVYYSKISGGYMTYTKHCNDQKRGRCEVVVDCMFTPEELINLSIDEIEDRMNRLLAHDDYIWNKEKQISFGNDKTDMAYHLDTLLYRCPKCGSLYEMETSFNEISCKKCGNRIGIDNKYNIFPKDENSVCPDLVTDWTLMEREWAKEEIKKENFSFTEKMKIGTLPKYNLLPVGATSNITGQGDLTLDKEGLHFKGINDKRPFEFDLPILSVPTYGMCTDISRFYTFVDGEFIEFYPENNDVLRWFHLTEEMHRACGGKWKEVSYRHTV